MLCRTLGTIVGSAGGGLFGTTLVAGAACAGVIASFSALNPALVAMPAARLATGWIRL
jgi:hypothetical protein